MQLVWGRENLHLHHNIGDRFFFLRIIVLTRSHASAFEHWAPTDYLLKTYVPNPDPHSWENKGLHWRGIGHLALRGRPGAFSGSCTPRAARGWNKSFNSLRPILLSPGPGENQHCAHVWCPKDLFPPFRRWSVGEKQLTLGKWEGGKGLKVRKVS